MRVLSVRMQSQEKQIGSLVAIGHFAQLPSAFSDEVHTRPHSWETESNIQPSRERYHRLMAAKSISDLEQLDIRVGTIVRCEHNEEARKSAFAIWIDFGADGIKQSSAQISDLYRPEDLIGSQVVAVTGFDSMKVGGFVSEVLVIGAVTDDGVVLLRPDRAVDPGTAVA